MYYCKSMKKSFSNYSSHDIPGAISKLRQGRPALPTAVLMLRPTAADRRFRLADQQALSNDPQPLGRAHGGQVRARNPARRVRGPMRAPRTSWQSLGGILCLPARHFPLYFDCLHQVDAPEAPLAIFTHSPYLYPGVSKVCQTAERKGRRLAKRAGQRARTNRRSRH